MRHAVRARNIIAIVAVIMAGCATAEPGTPTPEPQIAAVQPQQAPVKRRIERTIVPKARSPHKVQVARNVTAIPRGIGHAEMERLAEVMPCKESDTDCE
jgi:hypothetical protein